MKTGEIRIGTASWTDPGFIADWYPKGLPSSARLSWYAERFNLVEVNSSFYAVPSAGMVKRWAQQTPPGFVFNFKLHRLLSRHAAKADSLPPDLRNEFGLRDEKVTLTQPLESALAKRFLREIEPLAQVGKLGALLLQLSPAFDPKEHSLPELDPLLQCLAGRRVAVELRHRDWLSGEEVKQTLDFFRARQISFVSVDGPRKEHFLIMPSEDFVTDPQLGYLRCHGRNAEGYLRGRSVAERFNYYYPKDELQELAERAVKLAGQAQEVHVIYNNNASNYAPLNAAELGEILEQDYPGVRLGPRTHFPQPLEFDLGDRSSVKKRAPNSD